MPPYLRPISVLKRDIYNFSVNVYRDGKVDFLRKLCYVSKVQNAKHADRLRDPSVVDLAIRLIRWSSRPKERGRPYKPIFSNSIQKQMVTELNYAFAHRVDPLLCTAFITELGGHEIIGAMVSTKKSELQEGWLRAMQRGSQFRVSHEPTALYGTRKLRVMHTSEADALRHEEELEAKWEEEEAERAESGR